MTKAVHYQLTPMQKGFVENVMAGFTLGQSARRAGYKFPTAVGPRLLNNKAIAKALKKEQDKVAKTADMTREKLVAGLLEAVEIGRLQADANSMVSAYRELARVCGFYSPEKKQIDITVNGAVQVSKIEGMTDEELVRIIQGEATEIVDDGDEDLLQLPSFPQPEIPDDDDDSIA